MGWHVGVFVREGTQEGRGSDLGGKMEMVAEEEHGAEVIEVGLGGGEFGGVDSGLHDVVIFSASSNKSC